MKFNVPHKLIAGSCLGMPHHESEGSRPGIPYHEIEGTKKVHTPPLYCWVAKHFHYFDSYLIIILINTFATIFANYLHSKE